MSLKILSVNCNGLKGEDKRKCVFNYLNKMNCDIYCLQETHFINNLEETIKREWNGTWFFSNYTNISSGVAILFTKAAAFGRKPYCDDKGRCLIVEFCTEKKWYLLCCIYGYNEDRSDFFENLWQKIDDFNCENIIICGDFNLVLEPKLDYENHKDSNRNLKARKKVSDLMKEKDLVDIFRKMNPDVYEYTLERENPPQKGRLDFFLISKSLQSNCFPGIRCIEKESIEVGVVDHHIITLTLNGKGLWEFDNSFLSSNKFVESILKVIKKVQKQFLDPSFTEREVFTVNDQVFLEKLLEEIELDCNLMTLCMNSQLF